MADDDWREKSNGDGIGSTATTRRYSSFLVDESQERRQRRVGGWGRYERERGREREGKRKKSGEKGERRGERGGCGGGGGGGGGRKIRKGRRAWWWMKSPGDERVEMKVKIWLLKAHLPCNYTDAT